MRLALAFSGVALLALAGPAAAGSPPPEPPAPTGLARFTVHPRYVDARISPKGKYLAAVAVRDGYRHLVVMELATGKLTSTLEPGRGSMVGEVDWIDERRLVSQLVERDSDLTGPVKRGELYLVSADGHGGRRIFGYGAGEPPVASRLRRPEPEYAWAEVVDTLRHDDRHILISTRSMREVGDRSIRLWKLDVATGFKTPVAVSPVPEASFFTDADGEPQLAVALDERVKLQFFLRDRQARGGWRPLDAAGDFGPDAEPVYYASRARELEVVEPLGGGFGLFRVGLETGSRRLLGRTEVAPPDAFLRDPDTQRTLAYEWQADRPAWAFLEPDHPLTRVLRGLLDAHPGQHVQLVSGTDDHRLVVAYVYGDRQPGRWLVVEAATLATLATVAERPWIEEARMARVEPFHLAASDGFPIHGFLTVPPDLPPGERPPLVVLPHGGPHFHRDEWGFDEEAQLLASEGFAVLQVNYRGSGGYGQAYQEAGFGRWGDRLVQDVLDATRWVVREGRVDGARVCTYGASFGAYAAMQAASLAPELFRCAAGQAGLYDLTLVGRSEGLVGSDLGQGFVRRAVGEDRAALEAASPAHRPERITVPVLLAHGGNDRRVPLEHAKRLRDGLTRLGRGPEWLVEPAEGHGFYAEEARLRFATRLVAFLKANTAPAAAQATLPVAP